MMKHFEKGKEKNWISQKKIGRQNEESKDNAANICTHRIVTIFTVYLHLVRYYRPAGKYETSEREKKLDFPKIKKKTDDERM